MKTPADEGIEAAREEGEECTWHDGFLVATHGQNSFLSPQKRVTRMYLHGMRHYLLKWIERIDQELYEMGEAEAAEEAAALV